MNEIAIAARFRRDRRERDVVEVLEHALVLGDDRADHDADEDASATRFAFGSSSATRSGDRERSYIPNASGTTVISSTRATTPEHPHVLVEPGGAEMRSSRARGRAAR